jgi:hypothetical protein
MNVTVPVGTPLARTGATATVNVTPAPGEDGVWELNRTVFVAALAIVISKVISSEPGGRPESVTLAVTGKMPADVGVPPTKPSERKSSPGGNPVTFQE